MHIFFACTCLCVLVKSRLMRVWWHRRGQINLMETPGLFALARCTWMTSLRFADEITHQLWNRNCLRLQIDSQTDSFKADRQTQGQRGTDGHAVSLLKWVICIRLEPMCKYILYVFTLLLYCQSRAFKHVCFEMYFEMGGMSWCFCAGVAVNSTAGKQSAARTQTEQVNGGRRLEAAGEETCRRS